MSIISLSNSFDIKHVQAVCNNTTPKILSNYFHKHGFLTDKDFILLYKRLAKKEYCKEILHFISELSVKEQEKLLFDFKILNFFANISIDKTNLRFLLNYLKKRSSKKVEFLPTFNSFDQAIYILTNFQEDFYEAYSLCAHFEKDKTINAKAGDILDLPLILQKLIVNKRFAPPIEANSHIRGFYINQLTLINLYMDNAEIIIKAKHSQQNSEDEKTDPFCKLLEQYNIQNPDKYVIKEMEIVAVINIPHTDKNFRKSFIVNHKGETSLNFETVDELIRACLKRYSVVREINSKNQSKVFFFIVPNYSSKLIFKS